MSAEVAVVRNYYARVDADDYSVFDLFHEDVVYKRPGYPLLVGRAALEQFYRHDRVISVGRHTLDRIFLDGPDRLAVEGRFAGALKNGTTTELAFSDFFDLDLRGPDPLIIARRTYFDDVSV